MITRAPPSRRGALAAATVLVILLIVAAAAPIVAPYGMDVLDLARRRGAPSPHHWFGTDELGRDVLTRILFGARVSLAIGLVSAGLSAAIGVTVGAMAGYTGGVLDAVCMRFTKIAECLDLDRRVLAFFF